MRHFKKYADRTNTKYAMEICGKGQRDCIFGTGKKQCVCVCVCVCVIIATKIWLSWKKSPKSFPTASDQGRTLPCKWVKSAIFWSERILIQQKILKLPSKMPIYAEKYASPHASPIKLIACSVNLREVPLLLPERDYVTFGSLLSQFRLSVVCLSVCRL